MGFRQFNLDPHLMPAIERAGYTTPTPVQSAAIPVVMAGSDLIGTAQTGTGKTAAFVLPILHRLLGGSAGYTRALILTPTRELASQIHESVQELGSDTDIRCATVYGGVGPNPQIQAMQKGFEILVACPGRLLDHLGQGYGDLGGVEVLVLDEADRMLDMGFLPSIRKILAYLSNQRQTLMFSATFPPEIERFAAKVLNQPQRIAVGTSRPAHTVKHALYPVSAHQKTELLFKLLQQTSAESVLVFTRTKHRAQKLARQMEMSGYNVTSLHSNKSQSQRQSALKGFKSGTYQIMVATDIAARGLDIESISHVINFDMPATADDYIHRIGRTGRAERTGDAFTLVTSEDRAVVHAIEKVMGQRLPRESVEGMNYASEPTPDSPAQSLRNKAKVRPHGQLIQRTGFGR